MPILSRISSRPYALLAVFIALLLSIFAYQFWKGPTLPAYQIKVSPLVQNLVATGRITSPSRIQVGSEITGVVLERRVKEGDLIAPGDVLIILRSEEISARVREAEAALSQLQNSRRPQALAALRQAESQLTQARREAQRRRELLSTQSISREATEQSEQLENVARANAEQARLLVSSLAPGASEETILKERLAAAIATLDKSIIRSQVNGTVLTRNVEPGDLVQPGRVLLEIARTGITEILVPLDERNLNVLKLGQNAMCIADAYLDKPFAAKVSFIGPSIDPQRGTVDIRLTVDPVPEGLRQDMTVTVNIETGRRDQALSVPNDTLINVEGNNAEVLRITNNKVERTAVILGLRGLLMTEVTTGLSDSDWVAIAPNSKNNLQMSDIEDGMRVQIKELPLPASGSKLINVTGAANHNETPVKLD